MNYPNKQHDISLIYQARLSLADIKKKKKTRKHKYSAFAAVKAE